MSNVLLIYLLIGTLFALLIELAWPAIDDEPITWGYRIIAMLLWPLVFILTLIYLFIGDDGSGPIGPGGAH